MDDYIPYAIAGTLIERFFDLPKIEIWIHSEVAGRKDKIVYRPTLNDLWALKRSSKLYLRTSGGNILRSIFWNVKFAMNNYTHENEKYLNPLLSPEPVLNSVSGFVRRAWAIQTGERSSSGTLPRSWTEGLSHTHTPAPRYATHAARRPQAATRSRGWTM